MTFMSTAIAHIRAMEVLCMVSEPVRIGVFAVGRIRTVIAMMWIVVVIDVTVEVVRAVEPWSGSNKDAAAEPLRAIVAIRCALVRRVIVVTVGANRRHTNTDGNLGWRSGRSSPDSTGSQDGKASSFHERIRILLYCSYIHLEEKRPDRVVHTFEPVITAVLYWLPAQ